MSAPDVHKSLSVGIQKASDLATAVVSAVVITVDDVTADVITTDDVGDETVVSVWSICSGR